MSTLVLVMAAGMVLGDGPERVSAEVEERLNLEGQWEGLWVDEKIGEYEMIFRGSQSPMTLIARSYHFSPLVIDEGAGKLTFRSGRWIELGIYQQDNDRLIICFNQHR